MRVHHRLQRARVVHVAHRRHLCRRHRVRHLRDQLGRGVRAHTRRLAHPHCRRREQAPARQGDRVRAERRCHRPSQNCPIHGTRPRRPRRSCDRCRYKIRSFFFWCYFIFDDESHSCLETVGDSDEFVQSGGGPAAAAAHSQHGTEQVRFAHLHSMRYMYIVIKLLVIQIEQIIRTNSNAFVCFVVVVVVASPSLRVELWESQRYEAKNHELRISKYF